MNIEKLRKINGGPVLVVVNSIILQKRFQLDLKPNKHIIDPDFVALRRNNNRSEVISNGIFRAHCQYQSKEPTFAALDICDGLVIICLYYSIYIKNIGIINKKKTSWYLILQRKYYAYQSLQD